MAYVYKIVNDINGKIYVGKTYQDPHKRFSQHIYEFKSGRSSNRPLYRAFAKYGIHNFHVEILEETNSPEEREVYWIEKLRSFKEGYNVTLGGDGKPYLDRDLIIATYNEIKNIAEVASKLNVCKDSVRTILRENKIEIKSSDDIAREHFSKVVNEYSLKEDFIKSYSSIMDAAREVVASKRSEDTVNGVQSHISQVCNRKRKSAYGSIWKFAEK